MHKRHAGYLAIGLPYNSSLARRNYESPQPLHPTPSEYASPMVFLPSVQPLAPRASAFSPPTIPLNWSTVYACAVDVPSRVIAHDVTTQYPDNTPASCIERCDANNYIYAGVEYSDECHCGTGLVGTPTDAPLTDCNMACTGDPTLSCGGSFRIQVHIMSGVYRGEQY